jgi:hypothetical protein
MRAASLLVVACVLAACDRPDPLVVCHNANCVEPTRPEEDDTLPALRASLALSIGGLPAVDGTEIDTFLRGTDGACLFAHDLEGDRTTLASEAADELAAYIAATPRLTHSGKPFRIFIELKPRTDVAETKKHTPAERVLHADCSWDLYTRIAAAAVANARDVEIVFASFNPDLLREMIARQPSDTPIPFLYDAFYGIPRPLDPQTQPLSDYAGIPIELVEIHPQWIHDAQWEGLLSLNVETLFWTFSATVETFAAIEQYEPDWVGTSEANLMRRWLEN